MINVLKLYPQEGNNRGFDAVRDVGGGTLESVAGMVKNVPEGFDTPRVYVYMDRDNWMDSWHAAKEGSVDLADDDAVTGMILGGLKGMPSVQNAERLITVDEGGVFVSPQRPDFID